MLICSSVKLIIGVEGVGIRRPFGKLAGLQSLNFGPLMGPFFLLRLFGGFNRGHRVGMKSGNASAEHALQQRDLARAIAPVVGSLVDVARPERWAFPRPQLQSPILTSPDRERADLLPRPVA